MATILTQLKQENGESIFTEDQITQLEDVPETKFDDKLFINNIISLMPIMGFDDILQLINEDVNLDSYMFKTSIFKKPKDIIDNTFFKTLKQPRIITGYYKCTKRDCGSKNVRTRTLQTRSGDESSTDYNECQTCGNTWAVN